VAGTNQLVAPPLGRPLGIPQDAEAAQGKPEVGEDSMTGSPHSGFAELVRRAQGRYQRASARYFCQRPFTVNAAAPIISFTFDDFPRSAWLAGGAILQSFGVRGTYYISLGLMGKQIETGNMFLAEDVHALVAQGHELGCHTFNHCHAWNTMPDSFEAAILENRQSLEKLVPATSFKTLSYPISVPRVQTKRRVSKYFACCRGGGQTFNMGTADLNNLSAFFLEQSRENPDAIKRMIDENGRAKGWLIFAIHDISESPTRWGCTPALFEDVVRYSINSGSQVLPVFQACEILRAAHEASS
jgi:peptidoglycan/xylan/chitin deacetylase (PgdA/CDA1 family)